MTLFGLHLFDAKPVDTSCELNVKFSKDVGEPLADPLLYRQMRVG